MICSSGKSASDIVEVNRLGILELGSASFRSAGAGGRQAAVKKHRQSMLLDLFPERIEAQIVGEKMLPRGIELTDSMQTQLFFAAANLLERQLSLPRIDDAEAQKYIRVLTHSRSDMIIRNRRETGDGHIRRVHEHGHHLPRAILIGHFVDGDHLKFISHVAGHLLCAAAPGPDAHFIDQMDVHIDGLDIVHFALGSINLPFDPINEPLS